MKLGITFSKSIVCVCLTMVMILIPHSAYAATVPEGLKIGGIEINGKTADDALKTIEEYITTNLDKKIILDIAGHEADTTMKDIGYSWNNQEEIKKAITDSTNGNIIKRFMKRTDLELNPVKLKIDEVLSDEKVTKFVDDNSLGFADKAVDATISRENGKFIITPSTDGVVIDKAATEAAMLSALDNDTSADDILVKAVVTEEKAKIRTEDLEVVNDLLGSYTTAFASSGLSRSTNVKVGAEKINNHLLMPGETLSGYECMKPFTTDNGYMTAGAFENGRVVDSVGGGACQVATTLYNASLRAEIEIAQRQNHSMIVTYVPASADAAIAGTYKDIKITNNQDTPIYIEGYTKGKTITFSIYGKETRAADRTVDFDSVVLSSTPSGVTYIEDATLAAGQQVKEESGHSGRKSQLYKVIKVDGVETERILVSSDVYNMSNSIVRIGTKAEPVVIPPVQTQEETVAETTAAETQPVEGVNGGPGV